MSKKILVLTPRFPYPLIGGDKIRIYSICKGLVEAGNELTLLSFVTSREESNLAKLAELEAVFPSIKTVVLPKWRSYFNSFLGIFTSKPLQTSYYHSEMMLSLVNREFDMGNYDAILVHLIRMAPYVIHRDDIYKVLEMTDAISMNYAMSRVKGGGGLLGMIYRFEEKRAGKYERRCIEKFDFTVVVSPVDRDYLIKNIPPCLGEKVRVIPHGALDEFLTALPKEYDPNLIAFIGNLRTLQNNDAVLYFVNKIYPIITARLPKAKLRIIGANPSRKVKCLNGKNGIEVTGKVYNVMDYAKTAGVSISPIRIGAGMRGKILESLAMGIPVITTSVGAEGINHAVPGKHFLTADTPADFAEAVIRVMQDKELRRKLSLSGRTLVKDHYLYSKVAKTYAELFT